MPLTYSIRLQIPPTIEPVTVEEAKVHCRVPTTDTTQDAKMAAFITQAREYFEEQTGYVLMSQGWGFRVPCFRSLIQVPKPPLDTITQITYVNRDGLVVSLLPEAYIVNADSLPGVLEFPTLPEDVHSTAYLPTMIEYMCGVVNPSDLPQRAIQAILLLVGHWYEHREDAGSVNTFPIPDGYEALRKSLTVGTYQTWGTET